MSFMPTASDRLSTAIHELQRAIVYRDPTRIADALLNMENLCPRYAFQARDGGIHVWLPEETRIDRRHVPNVIMWTATRVEVVRPNHTARVLKDRTDDIEGSGVIPRTTCPESLLPRLRLLEVYRPTWHSRLLEDE